MDIKTSIVNVGTKLYEVVNTEQILYAVYLFAFFFGVFVLVNTALQKLGETKNFSQYKGKPAKVIAVMVTVITVGSIFYGKSYLQLLTLFNSFGGFIFMLFFGLAFIGGGVFLYIMNKDKNFNLGLLFLSLGFYIGTSLLIPQFPQIINGLTVCPADAFLCKINSLKTVTVFGNLFAIINPFAMLGSIICLVLLGFGVVKDGESVSESPKTDKKNKEEKEREKELKQINSLLNQLEKELKATNNHFNNKVNLLNQIRADIDRLKNSGGGN